MGWPALYRRRAVPLPTLFGALLLLTASAALSAALLWRIHPFLAVDEPAAGARLLVIEGWMPPAELDEGLRRYRSGAYARVVTTGGPAPVDLVRDAAASHAELARDYLLRRGLPAAAVTAVPAPDTPQDRSYLSAVMVKQRLAAEGTPVQALDVFSSGVHGRRTRLVYRLAFGPEVAIGILVARPSTYDPERWWNGSAGAKAVLGETISWLWTVLFFRPPANSGR